MPELLISPRRPLTYVSAEQVAEALNSLLYAEGFIREDPEGLEEPEPIGTVLRYFVTNGVNDRQIFLISVVEA